MVFEPHPASDELEAYSISLPSDAGLKKVEKHLRICERCQDEVASTDHCVRAMKQAIASPTTVKRLRSIHFTEDGPIFAAMHSRADGKWVARHWGRELDGYQICDSVEETNEYLTDSFSQMFPDHVCSEQCRVEAIGQDIPK